MVVLWNTSKVSKTREITVISKAHTDVDIQCMKIAPFDETRYGKFRFHKDLKYQFQVRKL